MKDLSVSIVIPVYNEKSTISEIITRVKQTPFKNKQIIVVDDGSTDGTTLILKELEKQGGLTVIYQNKNMGKGRALQLGFKESRNDIVIVQDADLEYFPEEYGILIKPIYEGYADAVFGMRFFGAHRCFLFTHYLGNKIINLVANLLFNTFLTDLECGLKAFRREILENICFQEDGFRIEVEITAKILRYGYRLYEIPISYAGRSYSEGKKITWGDGIPAIFALFKYRFWK